MFDREIQDTWYCWLRNAFANRDYKVNKKKTDVLTINRTAWDKIGARVASPYLQHDRYARFFLNFCDRLPFEGAVLDLGCGPGIPATLKMVRRGFRVVGVDFSQTMISLAKKNVPEAKFFCASITEIDFEDEFDGVFLGHSMLCLDPPNFAIAAKRAASALRSGGYLFLALNESSKEYSDDENLIEILGERMFSRSYSEKEVLATFTQEKLNVIQIERETINTKEYGNEHVIMFLFKKE